MVLKRQVGQGLHSSKSGGDKRPRKNRQDIVVTKYLIKALIALVGLLSLSVGWENGPERELKTVSFNF